MYNFINHGELNNIINKTKIYKKEQDLYLEEFKKLFLDCNYLYKTKNTSKLNIVTDDINKNLKLINSNIQNDLMVLNKTIEKYILTAQETAKKFDDLR